MTRKKVKLAYITSDAARKATFKKRKKGLMKKVKELSTLCGIDACAIMYSPYESQPEVWPSPMGVQRVISRFKKVPEMEQSKKMMNQESFLAQRITKTGDQLKKLFKDNREKEMTHAMFQNLIGIGGIHGLNMMDLNDLGWVIDQLMKDIDKRMEDLSNQASSSSSVPAPPPPPPISESMMGMTDVTATMGDNNVMDSMQRQWLMDLLNNNNPPQPQPQPQPQVPQQGHVGFGGADEMMYQFGNNVNVNVNNNNPLWPSNSFFQWEK